MHGDVWDRFVHVDAKPGQTLRHCLAGSADELNGAQFGRMRRLSSQNIKVRAHWRIVQNGQYGANHFVFQNRRILEGSFIGNAEWGEKDRGAFREPTREFLEDFDVAILVFDAMSCGASQRSVRTRGLYLIDLFL